MNSLHNNFECPEKERNRWHTEQQTLNRLTKENISSWWQKHCESWRKTPKQSLTSQTICIGQRWRYFNQPFKEDLDRSNIEAISQYKTLLLISSENQKVRLQFANNYRDEQQKLHGLMRPRLTSTKVNLICWELGIHRPIVHALEFSSHIQNPG